MHTTLEYCSLIFSVEFCNMYKIEQIVLGSHEQ